MKKTMFDFWKAQNGVIDQILNTSFSEYVKTIPNFEKAFEFTLCTIGCIDERVTGKGEIRIRIPGSGVLLSPEKMREVKEYVEKKCGIDVTGILSHEGCSDCKVYAKKVGRETDDLDILAEEQVQLIAKEMNVPAHPQVPLGDMLKPENGRPARVCYYDAGSGFDPYFVPELPKGFIVSRWCLNKEDAVASLELAINIALEGGGFKELFTKDTPFLIVGICDPKDLRLSEEIIRAELLPFVEKHEGRVKIDLFMHNK
jgi:hypothetical protein